MISHRLYLCLCIGAVKGFEDGSMMKRYLQETSSHSRIGLKRSWLPMCVSLFAIHRWGKTTQITGQTKEKCMNFNLGYIKKKEERFI